MTDGNLDVPISVSIAERNKKYVPITATLWASGVRDVQIQTSLYGMSSRNVPIQTTFIVGRVDYGLGGDSTYDSAPRSSIFFAQGGTPDKLIATTDPYWFIKSGNSESGIEGFMELGIGQNTTYTESDANLTGFVRVAQDATEGWVKIKPSLWLLPTSQPTTGQEGMMYYDSTAQDYKFWNGSSWGLVGGGAAGGVGGSGTQWKLPVWSTTTSLGDSMVSQDSGGATTTIGGNLTITSIIAGIADYDKFLVSDGGLVKFRTGAETLSDIGASSTAHLHDTQTLQHDGVNSNGGAFGFTTTGDVTFNQDVILGSGDNAATGLTITGTSNGKIEFIDGTVTATKYLATMKMTGDSDGAGDKITGLFDIQADHDSNASATTPIVNFRASNAGVAFATKDLLFRWYNWTTTLMSLDKDGDLGLTGDLTVSGNNIYFATASAYIGHWSANAQTLYVQNIGAGTTSLDVELNCAIGGDLTVSGGNVGIGRTFGAVGVTTGLELYGTDSNAAGPHIQAVTSLDNYPVLQILNWRHDNINIAFDAYLEGGVWKSSDAGTNFCIAKGGHSQGDVLQFMCDSGIAQGGAITWNQGGKMDASGNWTFLGDLTVSGENIYIGADVEIKRSAANILYTPDNMQIAGYLSLTGSGNLSIGAELDITGTGACIDLNPAGTGVQSIINITPSAAIVGGANWYGIQINGNALDPVAAGSEFRGLDIDFTGIDMTNNPSMYGVAVVMPAVYGTGTERAGHFSGDGRTVIICEDSSALKVTGLVKFNEELDITGVGACIDLNPAGTGSKNIIDITPSASLVAGSTWRGISIASGALDPATGAACSIYAYEANMQGISSADHDASLGAFRALGNENEDNFGFSVYPSEMVQNKRHWGFLSYLALSLSYTATYRGVHIDWDGITRDANAPKLEGVTVELPADYTGFGNTYAGHFHGDGRYVTICDASYALSVSGAMNLVGAITGVTTINMSGNLTVGGTVDGIDIAGSLNQAVKTTSSPTFVGLTLSGAIATPTTITTSGNITCGGNLTVSAGTTINEFSTDTTLGGNSDDALPTEKAVKAYVDAAGGGPGSGTQWKLPVWATTTTLGDSIVSQDSGGTTLTVAGDITLGGNDINNSAGNKRFSTTTTGVSVFGGGQTIKLGGSGHGSYDEIKWDTTSDSQIMHYATNGSLYITANGYYDGAWKSSNTGYSTWKMVFDTNGNQVLFQYEDADATPEYITKFTLSSAGTLTLTGGLTAGAGGFDVGSTGNITDCGSIAMGGALTGTTNITMSGTLRKGSPAITTSAINLKLDDAIYIEETSTTQAVGIGISSGDMVFKVNAFTNLAMTISDASPYSVTIAGGLTAGASGFLVDATGNVDIKSGKTLQIWDATGVYHVDLYSNGTYCQLTGQQSGIRFHMNITPGDTGKTVDIGNATYPFDTIQADDFTNVACEPYFKKFDNPLEIIRGIGTYEDGEHEKYDEYHLKSTTLPDWVRPRKKAYFDDDGKLVQGQVTVQDIETKEWTTIDAQTAIDNGYFGDWKNHDRRYILKEGKGRKNKDGKSVEIANYQSDELGNTVYNDEDFERADEGVSINKLLYVAIQAIQQLERDNNELQSRIKILEGLCHAS